MYTHGPVEQNTTTISEPIHTWGTSTTSQPWQIHGNVATAHILTGTYQRETSHVASYGSLSLSLTHTHTHTHTYFT